MAHRESEVVLEVRGLTVGYGEHAAERPVVSGVDLDLRRGRILGLVGETGCGKSTTALAAIGYRGRGARIVAGTSTLQGSELLSLDRTAIGEVWGRDVSYVPQNAGASLGPTLRVGEHFAQVLARHERMPWRTALARARELLDAVGVPDPEAALRRYPHQFSGGQQQRVSLALALACRPAVLVLDEPTTGLDVMTQARVTALLKQLVSGHGIAALYVSHDIGLLSELADRIAVMYAGQVVEEGPSAEVIAGPRHPYTRALMRAVPRVRDPRSLIGIPGEPPVRAVAHACAFAPRCALAIDACTQGPPATLHDGRGLVRCLRAGVAEPVRSAAYADMTPRADSGAPPDVRMPQPSMRDQSEPLLEVESLSVEFGRGARRTAAVSGVSFSLRAGETLGVVGLSGSGKSTVLRAIAGLQRPDAGVIRFRGRELAPLSPARPREVRRELQLVFQDPGSSLNPRHHVESLVGRPLEIFRHDLDAAARRRRVAELLELVRLPRSLAARYPWELSGGQQQRVAIARAFATEPALLLCDEVTSALDVSVQAAIIDLLRGIAAAQGTAVLFVSHDLAVVRSVADRSIVMLDGRVVEEGPIQLLFDAPSHEYTARLLAAIPDPVVA